jgi:hypothetical protein
MRKPNSLSVTFIAAAMYSVSAILMSAFADPGSSGGGELTRAGIQAAVSDKEVMRNAPGRDVNGDGVKELISTSRNAGTGFNSVWKHFHFLNGENYRLGLEYEKSSYETIEGSFIFFGATDWRQDVWALKETKGEVEFLDVDQDGFKELAKVSYTTRYTVQDYDKDRDPDGSVLVRVDEAIKDVFGEQLGVEKTWVEVRDWNPASAEYQRQ